LKHKMSLSSEKEGKCVSECMRDTPPTRSAQGLCTLKPRTVENNLDMRLPARKRTKVVIDSWLYMC
jgi:hypothetical protein